MASYYLELKQNSLTFPPVSKEVKVFFDESNKQVFAIINKGGITHVQVKGPDDFFNLAFELQEKGYVISIKFSPNQRVLAIQRSPKSIDFLNFFEGSSRTEYSQSCKGRSTQIIGCCWTGENEIVFVTNQGVEYYQVVSDKCAVKMLKTYHAPVNWFVFLPETCVLLLSSGIMGNVIHPYMFKNSSIIRLPKFEVENTPSARNPQPASLLERDVTIASIYNNIYVVVLRNHPRSLNAVGAEIVLYQLQKDSPARKTAVLRLGAVGRFAVNVVDNLISVHHQASKTSTIFDINLPGEFDGQVTYYYPVLSPLPIEPMYVANGTGEGKHSCESYSPNWVVFQPNIIVDAKLGCLWKLQVKLPSLLNMIEEKTKLIDFLLLRTDSKDIILSVFNQTFAPGQYCSLAVIAQIFDKINSVYAEYLEMNNTGTTQVAETSRENELTGYWFQKQTVIEQSDIYAKAFQPFVEKEPNRKFIMAVLLEYVRSLNHYKIPVEYYLNEFIIQLLVEKKLFYQLHQFLQYHVLSDSKSLAYLLLSLEKDYPPSYHLALDMLKRLGNNQEAIVDVLISRNGIVSALKFLQDNDVIDSAAPRKFLEASVKADDDMLFFTVFTFFQQRNYKLRKNTKFVRGEQCESYEALFEKKFACRNNTKHGEPTILDRMEYLQI